MRIGLFGVGHLGRIHLRCIQSIPEWDLVGIFEPDQERAGRVAEEFGVEVFSDALLTIPRTLASNAGYDAQEVLLVLCQ